MREIAHNLQDAEPWASDVFPCGPRGEAQDIPLACLIQVVDDLAQTLSLSRTELAGILGVAEGEWSMFVRCRREIGADERLETSLRLLCELLGSVLSFAEASDGGRWLRKHHPAMGDSPLGRLIRSPDALPWLSSILFEERRL